MILNQEKKNMQRYIRLSKWLFKHNINLIAAINGAIQSDRDLLRNEITNYKEIYLNCSLKERIKRDKKKLYERALKGEVKNVLDVDIKFDKPAFNNFFFINYKQMSNTVLNGKYRKLNFFNSTFLKSVVFKQSKVNTCYFDPVLWKIWSFAEWFERLTKKV